MVTSPTGDWACSLVSPKASGPCFQLSPCGLSEMKGAVSRFNTAAHRASLFPAPIADHPSRHRGWSSEHAGSSQLPGARTGSRDFWSNAVSATLGEVEGSFCCLSNTCPYRVCLFIHLLNKYLLSSFYYQTLYAKCWAS